MDTTTLQYLGIASGLLIASVGAGLLRSTIHARRAVTAGHEHEHHEHEHDHDHDHDHES